MGLKSVSADVLSVSTVRGQHIPMVRTILGDYVPCGFNHGKTLYQKHTGESIFMYYWDARDGDDLSGWWFGEAVGGTECGSSCSRY
mmetsp:Transcript_145153/g.463763  ORF Transcript_145153/g.463763 Transcript_145153/m.463763 type:complete len:86 (+) Transcript_145153:320-577(+)